MNSDTLLLRQVHPGFIQDGRITSQVFRPTPKDENLLSMYDGDMITPEEAWQHFTNSPDNKSAGVMAVTKKECDTHVLQIIEDRIPFKEHVSLNFDGKTKSSIERIAKMLKYCAEARGWMYKVEGLA